MVIRAAKSNDIPSIQDLARAIWPVTYGAILIPEQLEYMLDTFYNSEALQLQMKLGQEFFILEVAETSVGFAAVAINEKPHAAKLHKLYIMPHEQGKGWGKALVDYVSQYAISNAQKTLFLNVNRFNSALNFYQKLGFEIVETIDIPIGRGFFMEDYIMQKVLK